MFYLSAENIMLRTLGGNKVNINDDELLRQNPFQFNWREKYIACVGDNGGTTNDDILVGFKAAALLIINDIKHGHGTEDELIYPLVYSIRHSVELALKISINLIRDICDLKSVNFCIEEKKLHTHDIQKLSCFVKQLYSIDRRIPELFNNALEYAKDFCFDKQSDVFRYECNLERKKLLKELHISHICIGTLEKKFLRMYYLLDCAINYLSTMKDEYSVQSYTKQLSRYDIEQISKELMPISRWREKSFNENKNKIKIKYSISGNELSKAIDIIKTNPLFANNISYTILLGSVSDEDLKKYANLIAEFTDDQIFETKECNVGDGTLELLKKLPERTKKRKLLAAEIPNEALFSIAAFGKMVETNDCFCENYQKHYDYFKNNKFINRDWLVEKIGTYSFALKVLKAMKWCGQSSYMNILNPLIKKIAEDNNIPLNYEEWDHS